MSSYPDKKLINSPQTCVEDMLIGVKAAFPGLSVNTTARVVMRCQVNSNPNCVGVVSGGGSGHEPFCAGFVGKGMLNAAVAGSIFTSPPSLNCLTAIQNVAEYNRGGVLVLIPNYTGDVLNFAQAIEMAKDQGYKVESIIVGEDCALLGNPDDQAKVVGRRGLCGQLIMFKVAGALSNRGHNLSTMVEICCDVLSHMASFGVCTSPCTLPGASNPLFYLAPEHMELGLGVHGEAGVSKMNMCSAREAVQLILRKLLFTLSIKPGHEVAVLINNLGSSSQMESFIIAGEVSKQLGGSGIRVCRMYVGSLLTSLDMGGIQVCLLNTTYKRGWLDLLDDETEAFAWPGRVLSCEHSQIEVIEKLTVKELIGPELSDNESQIFRNCLWAVSHSLKSEEERLNLLDSGCGDGDTGTTLHNLADAILEFLDNLPTHRPTSCFLDLAEIASKTMGGTSGGIYGLLLRVAARMAPDWPSAFKEAVETVKKYSPAREGWRTMMDALIPACNEFERRSKKENWQPALAAALLKAEKGCEKTRHMEAKCGRASYVNVSYLKDVDAGAYGVTVWLRAIYQELCGSNNRA